MDDVYEDLRATADRLLRNERDGHTLQPTALVHEAFLRAQARDGFSSLSPLARKVVLAREMRWVLVDHARNRTRQKRGGNALRITLDESFGATEVPWIEILELDRSLDRLSAVDPEAVQIVELRFYGGFTEVEVAEQLGRSRRWVQKRWAWIRTWLERDLGLGVE